MIKVYLDNDVASGISNRDLDKAEQDAIDQLLNWQHSGKIEVGTSRQAIREMERAPFQYQAKLKTGISNLGLAENDHRVLGFNMQTDQYGCISSPLVTDVVDEQLYADLLKAGLETDDAKHLMYAVYNSYQQFLTCDKGILKHRIDLKKCCPSIQIQKPSELVVKLSVVDGVCEVGPTESKGSVKPPAPADS